MSTNLYTNLSWLPQPPADFSDQCRKLNPADGSRIQALASYALDENQLTRLAKVIVKATKAGGSLKPLVSFRLGIISNSTLDFVVPSLIATAARHGIALECIKADYDQVIQEALSPDSIINQAKPDAVLVAIDFRALPLRCQIGNIAEADRAVQSALSYMENVRDGLKTNSQAVVILQTLAPPPERLFGSLDRMLPGRCATWLSASTAAWRKAHSALTAYCWMWPGWLKPWDWPTGTRRCNGTWRSCRSQIPICRYMPTMWRVSLHRCAARAANAWCSIWTTRSGAAL